MCKVFVLKCLAAFSIAFAAGFGAARASVNLNRQSEVFSKEEARRHLYKTVQSLRFCNAKSIEPRDTRGKVFMIMKDESFGGYIIGIDWERSIRGKHEVIFYDKQNFERCIVETAESEE